MTVRHSPRSTRLGRLLRGLRLDRNPLRRGSDRAETVLLGVLIAAFVGCAPLAVHTAGSWTHAASAREAQVQQTLIHHVTATLLEATPAWGANGAGPYPETQAQWRAPDGKVRTGLVAVPGGASKGSTVTVWVNQAGQLSGPPLQPAQIQGRAVMAEGAAVAALAVASGIIAWLTRWALDKRRMAAWDAEWLANGPRWSSRR
jgi:hypothetical protein